MRRLVFGSLAATAAALCLAACGGSSTTSPSPTPTTVTENYSGELKQGGSTIQTFKVTTRGTVVATLTALSPLNTASLGMTLGLSDGTNCSTVTDSNNVKVGTQLVGTATTDGITLCLRVYDAGNIPADATWTYSATVAHY